MTAIVHRAATGHTPPLAVYELKGIARAMQAVTDYAAAIDSAITGKGRPGVGASESWSRVRQAVGVFHDGQRPDRDGPEPVLRAAAAVHDGLLAGFGPPDQILPLAARLDPGRAELLRVVLDQVPRIATELGLHTVRLPGRLVARADQLPVTDDRVSDFLHHRPVLTRGDDFLPVIAELTNARALSGELAASLGSNPALASGTHEPLLAAGYLTGRFRAEPGPAQDNALPARAMTRSFSAHPAVVGPER